MNFYVLCFLIILVFNIIKNKKSLHMLQQNLYNENNRYLKWLKNNTKNVFVSLDFIAMILIILAVTLNKGKIVLLILAMILYVAEALRLISNYNNEKVKKPLVITKRIKRLIITISILFLIPVLIYVINYDY